MSVDEIFQTMRDLVSEQFAMEPAEVTMDTSFEEDLGADSVDLVELVMAMEEEFDMGEANEDELAGLKTVGDAVNFVASKLKMMIYQFGCAFTGNLNVIGLICAILALAGIIYMLVRPYKEATTLKA